MRKILMLMAMAFACVSNAYSKPLFPDSETAKSEVELGVEMIQRLCPTGMWDCWTFRDIVYDDDSKTVLFVVQLKSWRDKTSQKEITEEDVLKKAQWIIANFKEGYEELIKNPSISCDGDFMLYLSLGTLLKQMEKDNVNLRIMLLKPDYLNQAFGDKPMILTSEQLKAVEAK